MSTRLLWDAGPGEVRYGLEQDGALTEFRIVRPRRDGAVFAAGERYTARIVSHLGGARAIVTLGSGADALLQPAPALPEGALLCVEMKRAPVPEPGRWKRALVRPVDGIAAAQPCWVFSADPWETALQRLAPQVDAIVCPEPACAGDVERLLGDQSPPVTINPQAIEDADFDGVIEQAVGGIATVSDVTLSIERTRAMTMIDIDGAGDTLAINRTAAKEIPRLLRLFGIGGPIGIDFVGMANRAARTEVDTVFAQHCSALGSHERTAINGFGFAQLILPRTGPSVSEILCETTPGRLSRESRAIALLREAGRSRGIGARHLVAPPAIIELIRGWPEETEALRFQFAADIVLVPDATATGYGHVHVKSA